MIQPFLPPPYQRALAGLALTLALHLALVLGWRLAMQAPSADDADRTEAIHWITMQALLPARKPTPSDSHAAPRPRHPVPDSTARAQPSVPAPVLMDVPAPVAATPERSVDDILQQARRDLGKIDQDLRKEYPGPRIAAPVNTARTRLEKGFADAAAAAPNKWFEAPKVTEIIDPGGYGRRRYRVVTAGGTYCVTYESNHAPDGRDSMRDGIPPKLTNCDEDEQAPTHQW